MNKEKALKNQGLEFREDMLLDGVKNAEINCIIVKDDCVIIEPTQKDLENQGFVAGSICF